MHSEIRFLFDPSITSSNGLSNDNDRGNIYGRALKIRLKKSTNSVGNDVNPPATPNNSNGKENIPTNINQTTPDNNSNPEKYSSGILMYKGDGYAGDMPNYLKNNVYREDTDEDPYIALIRNFGGFKPLRLRAADFAYLRDLGVYPINRLWILRRFPDNSVVPNNLLSWSSSKTMGSEAISTVIGWIKPKEDSDMFTVNFNESWVDQPEWIDKVFANMLQQEFGISSKAFFPVPGWGQGMLFGVLKAMGLTSDFDAKNPPSGDPNVLRTAKMREITRQSLESNLQITLETSYEQKYINGVDPGMAMMDIITNLLKMGTSDQKFILGNSPELQNLLSGLNNNPNTDAWVNLGKQLIQSFINGVEQFISDLKSSPQANINVGDQVEGGASVSQTKQEKPKDGEESKPIPIDGIDTSVIKNAIGNISEILIAGTVMKYRWPIKGSIGAMTGMNTTPWHLTVGNPYSPILNMGNIVVRRVDISPSNELGFNDMPINLNVKIEVEMGRPFGKSELERVFNNGYKRVYSSDGLPVDVLSNPMTKNGSDASTYVTGAEKALTPGTPGFYLNK